MTNAVNAYVALGSNLGDRWSYLRQAAEALARTAGVQVAAASPVFETEAVSETPQPPYLNAVLRLTTTLTPRALLARCLDVEATMGRQRPIDLPKAPRTIDLDVLLVGAMVVDQPGLQVPHPGLLARAFVRVPLAAVAAPGLCHPVTRESLEHAASTHGVRPWPDASTNVAWPAFSG